MKSFKEKRKVECSNLNIQLDGNYNCVLYPCEKCKYKQFFFYKEKDINLVVAELLNEIEETNDETAFNQWQIRKMTLRKMIVKKFGCEKPSKDVHVSKNVSSVVGSQNREEKSSVKEE